MTEPLPQDEGFQPCPRCGTLFMSISDVCTACLTQDYEEEEDK